MATHIVREKIWAEFFKSITKRLGEDYKIKHFSVVPDPNGKWETGMIESEKRDGLIYFAILDKDR